MNPMQLPTELLKHILILLAMSSDGAKDLVQVLLVSRGFKEFALSKEVLGAIEFCPELLSDESNWNRNGLIIKSARAGNLKSYEEITMRIKGLVDDALYSLDCGMKQMESFKAKVENGSLSAIFRRRVEEIMLLELVGEHILRPISLEILKVETLINAFGRPFFRDQSSLLHFDDLKEKFDKFSSDLRSSYLP